MSRWVLLLRAVNLGPRNKLPMGQLAELLRELGHGEVTTYLNSGNATFTSTRRSARALADEVEEGLRSRLGLDVRACVRRDVDVAALLDALPELPGYVTVVVLFEPPDPATLGEFLATDWSPEVVRGTDQALYIGFRNAGRTNLTNVLIERRLGVSSTARTPATLRKLLLGPG